ncbi:MAG: phospholipase D-like domain-containing protein [Gammaproteobacteria bacterium]|nr:phospholipase D-like domain-containing protein [Gammaproteobacteria bacterium]
MPTYVWVLIQLGSAAWSVYHILLYKRDPRSAMGWIMACVFIPYVGPFAYFLFGINRVRLRARGMKRRLFSVEYESGERQPNTPEQDQGESVDPGQRITGKAKSPGNQVTPLYNGEATYPAMLDSIARARQSILLATFILKADKTGTAFAKALGAAAERGIEVMVLVDGIGELYSLRKASGLLRKYKVKVARFLPPRLFPPSIYINLRNHRKLLIVDNEVAYAGGMNISDNQTSLAGQPRSVSDVHFCLHGPVVAELSEVFCRDWYFATHQRLVLTNPSPPKAQGDMGCRVVPDGPDDELDSLALSIQTAISAATESIDIMTPYFLPGRELMTALLSASLRGVKLRIILPGKNNLFYMHWANRNLLAELLDWDIQAFYQPAPFCHSKLLCIDGHYSLVGSANLDPRSLRLNFELGIEVFSESLNRKLCGHFEQVLAVSTRIRHDDLARRSLGVRLRDSAVALLSPYL